MRKSFAAGPPTVPIRSRRYPVIFGSWIFYALIGSSVFIFRRKYPEAIRPYRVWGYPVVPIVYLLVAGWLLINTMMTAPTQSFIGIGLIIIGLPVYYYLANRRAIPTETNG